MKGGWGLLKGKGWTIKYSHPVHLSVVPAQQVQAQVPHLHPQPILVSLAKLGGGVNTFGKQCKGRTRKYYVI